MPTEKSKCEKVLFYILPAFIYAGLIFYLSSKRGGFIALELKWEDKLIHVVEFLILGWFLFRGVQFGRREQVSNSLVFTAIAIGILYGASDEIHQYFVPGRSPEFLDWLADSIGVILGVLGYRRYHTRQAQSI